MSAERCIHGFYAKCPEGGPDCIHSAESSFAAPSGYTAAQQLEMLCEILRNVNNGVMHINAANFDHAALDLEVAASKLRTLQKEKAV